MLHATAYGITSKTVEECSGVYCNL